MGLSLVRDLRLSLPAKEEKPEQEKHNLLSSNKSKTVKVWMILLENHFFWTGHAYCRWSNLPILLSSDTLNSLYLPLPGNTDVLPVTLSESGCFPSHPVCSHLSCLPLISFHLPPVMFSSCPCLTAACFPLGQVFFDAWPQHQASPQIQLEPGCRFQIKRGFLESVILHKVWRAKRVTLMLVARKMGKWKDLSESDMGQIVMAR